MGEVDTGPGLEAQISWDYSHSQHPSGIMAGQRAQRSCREELMRPCFEAMEAEDARIDVATNGLPTEAAYSNREPAMGPTASTNPRSDCREGHESMRQPESAFQPASTEAFRRAEDAEPSAVPGPTPERAETVEEKDFRVRAEKRQQRTERAAQISSLAILSLLLIASTLFLVLAYTGWNVVAAAAALFCASVAGYPSLQLLWYALSSQMFSCWRHLDALERFKWGQRGSSLVHSAIMAILGISVVVFGEWSSTDLINGRDDRVAAFLALELGFLLQETGMEVYKQIAFGRSFSLLQWLHHLVILAALPWYYKYYKGDFFFGAFFLWNTSTVPLQLRRFQAASGVSKGPLYQLNNVALLLSFLPCRILIIPYLMYKYGATRGWPLQTVILQLPHSWTCAGLGLMAINVIWLFKLLRDAFKPRRRRQKKSKAS